MTGTPAYDVVIVGGGVIGSSIAYFLAAEDAFSGTVAVIEKDPTYVDGSTARSVGGIRQQFSTPENIEISKFGSRFFRTAAEVLEVDGEAPDLAFTEAGYLMLATAEGLPALEGNLALQTSHGVATELLSRQELARRFPWLCVDDLAAGTLGTRGEGWLDPFSLLMAFKRKARDLGVAYLSGEVIAVDRVRRRVTGVGLRDGGRIQSSCVVDAAGPRAAEVAAMAGILDLPVRSRKRQVFTFECPEKLPGCPMVVDPGGLYFRPEGDKFVCGTSPQEGEDPDCHDFKVDPRGFEDVLWPALAHRVPAFDRLREGSSWAGHYAVNVRDRNAVLGPHPELEGFHFAAGFSGHGLQQAPAVGRAISELIACGGYRTLDLSRFSFARFAAGRLVEERNVI